VRWIRASSFLLAGLPTLLAGCATLRTAQCTSRGGEPWYEFESPHFRLRSNADFERALRTANELEKYRRALLAAWGEQFDPPGQLDVIGLSNRDQLSEFVNTRVAAYLTLLPGGWQAVMALDYPFHSPSEAQLHELAHHLSHYVLLRQPKWLSEGLATYLQTATVKDSPSEIILGEPHRASLEQVRQRGWLSLQQLWTWSEDVSAPSRSALYASSWLWFHYLTDEHHARFVDFQNRLSSAEEPLSAWDAAFSGVSPDVLERGLREYLDEGRFAVRIIAATLEAPRVIFRRMDDAEIHTTRARLYLTARRTLSAADRRDLILSEVVEALGHDPRNESARILQAELASTRRERLAIAQQLVNSSAGSSASWSLFARSLDQDENPLPDLEQLLQRAASASVNDAAVLSQLASYYVKHGAAEKGLDSALRAVRLAPWQAGSVDTYAAILARVGNCDLAVSAQKRAMGLLGEYASEELRMQYQKRLAEYAQRCPRESR